MSQSPDFRVDDTPPFFLGRRFSFTFFSFVPPNTALKKQNGHKPV
nr:MAG TPA: hypothetical protein [Bacteriophage sp.]